VKQPACNNRTDDDICSAAAACVVHERRDNCSLVRPAGRQAASIASSLASQMSLTDRQTAPIFAVLPGARHMATDA